MTIPRRNLLLGAAAVAVASLTSGVSAAAATTNMPQRWLQSTDGVRTVCPDGTQCEDGDRCYKTGNKQRNTGLEEYKCGDCEDIDDNNGRCEFAAETFCVVGDGVDPSTWFCVNEGRCINDRVGSNDRARCQCPRAYEGPNCQLESSSSNNQATDTEGSDVDPASDVGSRSESSGRSLSNGAIIGIAVGGFVVLVGLLLLLGRRKKRDHEDEPDSVIDSVDNSQFQHNQEFA
mmetsp:Transcript_8137/g.17627  ORF Transcript_8137/g.17627 Transcript_8137/m.17627 type:complete len:232 (-) Transcript_8137:132-827(-)|eukprot:CAMPEP_0178505298 /NCGR_PEP_ID=MMETSP0696-20121128/19057_1 /TAXON_ID=265572 /ORGANISM="Extubocellulus spinifer, Strain CCMP396" /LENGTH=231 /DNA_ID=CAMNT_0020134601 /DNA_START=134 /DNA_END=829 /DNA_ORIENTATION=-